MKRIFFFVFTPLLGIMQLLVIHLAYLVGNLNSLLWDGSSFRLASLVHAKHKEQDEGWTAIALGYMDGTYGWMSYLLAYEAAFEYNGRVRLVNFTYKKDGLIEEEVVNGYRC